MHVEELLRSLSTREKIELLVGTGVPKKLPGAAGETRAVRGVPSILLTDGPSGVRIEPVGSTYFFATAFPAPIALASTWNPEIVEEVGRAMGEEALDYGVDVLLAPAVNMHRNILCGRNFEYFSEDPLLAGEMAAAFIHGVQSTGVCATIKHFVANEQEVNRTRVDTVVSERALREIYLKPFEIAIKKSKPCAVMSAYNKLNGEYCSQNPWLLIDVLRNEWGFNGLVMSDWGAGDNPVKQIKAQNDLIMPGNDKIVEKLVEAVETGLLSLGEVEKCAERVLRLIAKTPTHRGHKPTGKPRLKEHSEVAYKAAVESIILLENNGALPLKPGSRIAVFGTGQVETLKGGLGSGHTHPPYVVTILEGLKASGFIVDEELSSKYVSYVYEKREKEFLEKLFHCEVYPEHLPQDIVTREEVEKYAERNDVALIVITRISGEGWDRELAKGDYYLADDELGLIREVSESFHKRGKRVVVVLNVAGVVEVDSWRNLVDAILLVWLPGQEAGRAIADILAGVVSPSGKLPTTFPRDWRDTPIAKSTECYPGVPADNPQKVVYCEDIYVGYRYYDTFNVEPAYEFGYGLSYTDFEYRNMSVELSQDTVRLSVEVVNVGNYPGKEVVQVYVKAPSKRIKKPFQELKAFKKTRLLKPGESEVVAIELKIRDMASFDNESRLWVLEEGEYEIRVGSSSRNIKLVSRVYLPEKTWSPLEHR